MELHARLVVLGSCQSLDSRDSIGHAFLAAGALTVVGSLYNVDDAATAALMTHFYKAVLSDGNLGDVAAALRTAVLTMISEGHALHEWAAFVAYGLG